VRIVENLRNLFSGPEKPKKQDNPPEKTTEDKEAALQKLAEAAIKAGAKPLTPEDIHPNQSPFITRAEEGKLPDTGVTPTNKKGGYSQT